jgi:hypothetical protein
MSTLKIHSLKRQQAAGLPHKIIKTNKGKLGQKSNHMGSSKRTHIMLRCCVLARAGKARKTAKYAPRRNSRCARKAHFCCGMTYNALLETAYFNSLRYRPIDLLRMVRER